MAVQKKKKIKKENGGRHCLFSSRYSTMSGLFFFAKMGTYYVHMDIYGMSVQKYI